MAQAYFALSWDSHKKSICEGLSSLQQNCEFVDMTLAADGHMVKVHQMIIALASPYLKELIASAQCPHPVIFLNKVSYATLSSLLEYIYGGEVLVEREQIPELLEAAKELHIKGLEDVKIQLASNEYPSRLIQKQEPDKSTISEFDSRNVTCEEMEDDFLHDDQDDVNQSLSPNKSDQEIIRVTKKGKAFTIKEKVEADSDKDTKNATRVQFTVTNHGALSMILNRYMYYLVYTSRTSDHGRTWRCVNKDNKKCPAGVITEDDIVIKRFGIHNHPFHDAKILKKVQDKAVFATITDAEAICTEKKRRREADKHETTSAIKKSRTEADTTSFQLSHKTSTAGHRPPR